jgi:hypothetical protein
MMEYDGTPSLATIKLYPWRTRPIGRTLGLLQS